MHQNQSIWLKADVEGFDTLVDLALNLRRAWSVVRSPAPDFPK